MQQIKELCLFCVLFRGFKGRNTFPERPPISFNIRVTKVSHQSFVSADINPQAMSPVLAPQAFIRRPAGNWFPISGRWGIPVPLTLSSWWVS